MSEELPAKRHTIALLGGMAILGGLLSVMADVYSAYSPDLAMNTAFSVGYGNVVDVLLANSAGDHLIGSLLGQFFIPFHIPGWVLMYAALKPASLLLARAAFVIAVYATIVGASLHGSLVYAAAVGRVGDAQSISQVAIFFDTTAYFMVAMILVLALLVAVLIVSGKTRYPRWTVLLSPFGYFVVTTAAISVLPVLAGPASAFLTATGFNLPATILHATTLTVLLRQQVSEVSA